MYTTAPKNFDPVQHLIADAIWHTHMISSSTKKDEAHAQGIFTGTLQGIGKGIAAILTARRCEKYGNFDYIQMVDDYHAFNLIKRADTFWKELEESDKGEGVTDYQHRKNMEPRFWEYIDQQLQELTYPADMEKAEAQRHMSAVLAGTEEATEDDREWLQAKLDDAKKLGKQLESLVRVNQPESRPIKDQPQA